MGLYMACIIYEYQYQHLQSCMLLFEHHPRKKLIQLKVDLGHSWLGDHPGIPAPSKGRVTTDCTCLYKLINLLITNLMFFVDILVYIHICRLFINEVFQIFSITIHAKACRVFWGRVGMERGSSWVDDPIFRVWGWEKQCVLGVDMLYT